MPKTCVQPISRTSATKVSHDVSLGYHDEISYNRVSSVTKVKSHPSISRPRGRQFNELSVVDDRRNHILGGRYLACTGFQSFLSLSALDTSLGKSELDASVLNGRHYDTKLSRHDFVKDRETTGLCFTNENFSSSLEMNDNLISHEVKTSESPWTFVESTDKTILNSFICFAKLDHADEQVRTLLPGIANRSCFFKRKKINHKNHEKNLLDEKNKRYLCRIILGYMNSSQLFISICSRTAQRSYALEGRGGIVLSFKTRTVEGNLISSFMEGVDASLAYICLDMLHAMASENEYLDSLRKFECLCKQYDPEHSYVFAVNINGQFESCCKCIRGNPEILTNTGNEKVDGFCSNVLFCLLRLLEVSLESNDPQSTLILTPLPGTGSEGGRRAREICFTNIQQKLRERGIVLRHQFPDIYRRLCAYAEKNAEFAPICLYPLNQTTGKRFFCAIMPNSEPVNTSLRVSTSRLRHEILV